MNNLKENIKIEKILNAYMKDRIEKIIPESKTKKKNGN